MEKETIKPRLLIYDLDGCVIDSSARLKRTVDVGALERDDYQGYVNSFNEYHKDVDGDQPIPLGIKLVACLRETLCADRVVALTSRGIESFELTLGQLRSYMPWEILSSDLLMRPTWPKDEHGNMWSLGMPKFNPVDYKRDVTMSLMGSYDVICAVDDHALIIAMYRALGINAVHLQHADIDCLSVAGDKTV